jgi:hypothetical protein
MSMDEMNIDLNLVRGAQGSIDCRHCGATTGTVADPLAHALRRERPSSDAGPGIHADPKIFTDSTIVLRQQFCSGCYTLLATEIVPQEETSYRKWSLA